MIKVTDNQRSEIVGKLLICLLVAACSGLGAAQGAHKTWMDYGSYPPYTVTPLDGIKAAVEPIESLR